MTEYKIELTLKSPTCISQKRGTGNVIETLDFIPGSTIRGALAEHYLQNTGKDGDFDELFLSDKVHYGNCYPENASVIPFTATSCKHWPGFRTDPPDAEKHGVLDMLLPIADFELKQKNQQIKNRIDKKFEACETCDAVMDKFYGYYKKSSSTLFEKIAVSKRLLARTAILDSIETALPGSFYTIEVLNEKKPIGKNDFTWQRFSSHLKIDESEFQKLKAKIGNITLRIGIGKSRALGETSIKFIKTGNDGLKKAMSERFEGLNNQTRLFAPHDYFFSITLHSDVILMDDILRYKSAIDIQDLIDIVPIKQSLLNKFQPLRNWISTHQVSGWSNILKLPKEDEIAISKGSVLLFVTKQGQTVEASEQNELISAFEEIENCGIGERKTEGFGRIRICDEFHWEVLNK